MGNFESDSPYRVVKYQYRLKVLRNHRAYIKFGYFNKEIAYKSIIIFLFTELGIYLN